MEAGTDPQGAHVALAGRVPPAELVAALRALAPAAASLAHAPAGVLRIVADYARYDLLYWFRADGAYDSDLHGFGAASGPRPGSLSDARAPAEWRHLTPAPVQRRAFVVAECAGSVYTSGGIIADRSVGCDMERYDIASDTWAALAPMPLARFDHAAVACGSAIYVLGGRISNGAEVSLVARASCDLYSIAENTWSAMPSMSAPRTCHTATAVDACIYAFGGVRGVGCRPWASGERFDTVAATWSPTAPMPTPRYKHRAVRTDADMGAAWGMEAEPSVLVCGGGVAKYRDGDTQVFRYRVGNDTWHAMRWNLPVRYAHLVQTVDAELIVCGGDRDYDDDADAVSECWRLADATGAGRWARLPLRPLHALALASYA